MGEKNTTIWNYVLLRPCLSMFNEVFLDLLKMIPRQMSKNDRLSAEKMLSVHFWLLIGYSEFAEWNRRRTK